MSRVIKAFQQFFDESGAPVVNGWLKFLYSGTNNSLKDTYADTSQTIPNANPLQLDAGGRCPDVFGLGSYRVVLYENNPVTHVPGAQLQVFDPVQAEAAITGAGDDFADWDSTVSYSSGSIVKVGNDYYRSYVAGNLNNYPPTNLDKWEQIDFVRFWNSGVTYETSDLVVLSGIIYTSLQDSNINNPPASSPLWWDSVGAGTVLLSWEEDGATLRPLISGSGIGDTGHYVGDIVQGGDLVHIGGYSIYINTILALSISASRVVTFANFPIGPSSAPTTDYQLSNKKYTDDVAGALKIGVAVFTFANLASPPATPVANDLWYVSDKRFLKAYSGSVWLDVKSEIYFVTEATNPTGALNDIWYATDTNTLKVHDGAIWQEVVGSVSRQRETITATAGQTAFVFTVEIYNESVHMNGVLLDPTDYVITLPYTVTLNDPAILNDIVSVEVMATPTAITTSDYVLRAGDTMIGNLSFPDNKRAYFGSSNQLAIYNTIGAGFIFTTNDDLRMGTGGTGYLQLYTGNTKRFELTYSALLPGLANTYDIGSATYELKNIFLGTGKLWFGIGQENHFTLNGTAIQVGGDLEVVGDAQFTSINTGQIAGLKNHAMNGAFDIWQRGVAFTIPAGNAVYTADRWRITNQAGGDTVTVSRHSNSTEDSFDGVIPAYFIKVAITAGGTATEHNMVHRAEEVRRTSGKQFTFSVNVYNEHATDPIDITLDYRQDFGATGSALVETTPEVFSCPALTWTKIVYTATFASVVGKTIDDADNFYQVRIKIEPNITTNVYFAVAQWEEGPVATPFEITPIPLVLYMCQRYFEKSLDYGTYPLDGVGGLEGLESMSVVGVNSTTTQSNSIKFKVTKYRTPSVIAYRRDGSTTNPNYWRLNAGTYYPVQLQSNGQAGFLWRYTAAAGLSAGNPYVVDGHWTADAEIT